MRLLDLQNKWLKKHTMVDAIKEQVALEQFLSTLALEKRAWARDKIPDTCMAAGELADEYELAWKLESQEKLGDPPTKKLALGTPKKWCSYCKISGHTKDDCRKLHAKKEG